MAELPQNQTEIDTEEFTLDLDLKTEDGLDVTDDGSTDTLDTKANETDNKPTQKSVGNGKELTDLEKIAYSQGWRPKEEFVSAGNDPAAWKDAAWWLDRGELLGQQAALRKELKQVKDAFVNMTKHSRDAYVKGQQDMLQQLKAEKRAAMKAENFEAVADLDEKIDQQQELVNAVIQEAAQPILATEERTIEKSALYQNWLSENRWYTTDPVLHTHANSWMSIYVKNNPTSTPDAALRELSNYIKTEFAHKFEGTRRVASPNVGGRGTQTSSSNTQSNADVGARFEKIVKGMDIDTRRVVIDMIRSGVMSKKEYVENYID